MRRSLLVAVLASMLVMAMGASAAFAGEVTGSGKGGPEKDGIPGAVSHGRSACLFSGLEDGGEYPGQPAGPGVAPQNWGHVKDAPIVLESRGASWVKLDFSAFEGEPPGTIVVEEGCNPTLFEDHGH